jgi:hypothetical protein
MADTEKKGNSMTDSSLKEAIRPVSYTGPLMPRPTSSAGNSIAENQSPEKQPTILVPDFSEYFQKFMDCIFQQTKEEPALKIPEKTATAEFSEKKDTADKTNKKEYYKVLMDIRMKSDPYNKLMYDQCVLEGCPPDTCANKYFPEMS